jgi:hypothetical protein
MEKNFRAVDNGDPVEDEWEFRLVVQTDAAADRLEPMFGWAKPPTRRSRSIL